MKFRSYRFSEIFSALSKAQFLIIYSYEFQHVKHVLVLAPVNTLKNWEEEFYKWLVDDLEDDINVHEISGEKDNWGRTDRLRYWRKNGGAMIMG